MNCIKYAEWYFGPIWVGILKVSVQHFSPAGFFDKKILWRKPKLKQTVSRVLKAVIHLCPMDLGSNGAVLDLSFQYKCLCVFSPPVFVGLRRLWVQRPFEVDWFEKCRHSRSRATCRIQGQKNSSHPFKKLYTSFWESRVSRFQNHHQT